MYKKSIFNSVIRLSSERVLIYNSLEDKFCFLTNSQLDSCYRSSNNCLSDNLFKQLVQEGFFIPEYIDELHLLKQKLDTIDSNRELLQLIINPTMDCNLRCWYCYESHVKGSRIFPWVKEAIVNLLNKEVSRNMALKRISLSFFGGEPFLFFDKDVFPLMLNTKTICEKHSIIPMFSFTSNGVLISQQVQNKLSQIGNCCFQITLDGSKDFHDQVRINQNKNGSFEVIMKHIVDLLSREFFVTVRINLTQKNIAYISDLFSHLLKIPIQFGKFCRIDFQKVWQEQISEESLNELQEKAAFLYSEHSFHSTYMHRHRIFSPCYAESEYQAIINYNGDVFKCSARDFLKKNRDGVLLANGDINWNKKKKNKRRESVLEKRICRSCRVAPLCGGGCSQLRIENNGEECVYHYSESDIDDLILSRFENLYIKTV